MIPDIIHARRCDCTDDVIGAKCFLATRRACSEVRDLKARLKAIRAAWLAPGVVADRYVLIGRTTDLRVKAWRKP